MNSYFEYVPGRATQSYRAEVDEAAALAERQKQRVDPMYLVGAKSACLRFPLREKLRPLPCASSPHRNRFAGSRRGPDCRLLFRTAPKGGPAKPSFGFVGRGGAAE